MNHNKKRPKRLFHVAVAHRFYPTALSFRDYISKVNALPGSNPQIDLDIPNDANNPVVRAYLRLIDRLIVAFPNGAAPSFPRDPTAALPLAHTISLDQVLADIITSVLRSHVPSIAAQRNVLCSGLSLAHQNGPGSVLRNLDARSPSAPIQTIFAPSWRLLLRRVGHAILVHLLTYCVLLLNVGENRHFPDVETANFSSVFIQLCGPIVGGTYFSADRTQSPSSKILLRRDMLHLTPIHRSKGSAAREFDRLQPQFKNDGLSNMHHLHRLSASSAPVSLLVPLIFAKYSRLKECFGTAARKNERVRDFDALAIKLLEGLKDRTSKSRQMALSKAVPRRLSKIKPLLHQALKGVQKYSFRRTLGFMCPLPKVLQQPTAQREHLPMKDLINMNSSGKDVFKFLIVCCRQALPKGLFGSLHNMRLFERAVHELICHRQLKESFDVAGHFAKRGFRITDVPWLYSPKEHKRGVANPLDLKFRQSRMNELLIWIFRGLLIPILQQNFLITEGNIHRNKVFFFRREVWTALTDAANDRVLRSNGQFSILSRGELALRTKQRDSAVTKLGSRWCPYPILIYHYLRFLPKQSSMRGLQLRSSKMLTGFSGISRSCRENGRVEKGLNRRSFEMGQRMMRSMMNNILNVLFAESRARPTYLGASVFSLDDIYQKWLHLKMRWESCGRPKMFACCVDIEKSFDTIPLKTLEDVVVRLLRNSRYPIVKTRVCKHDALTGRLTSRMLTHPCLEGGDETSFLRLIRKKLSCRHAGGVFVDAANVSTLTREEILVSLRELFTNNLVSVPRRCRKTGETGFAVQRQGVPQGHPLSPLLTSLFYAHVEREDLKEFLPHHGNDNDSKVSLLMRQVDDTLFISREQEETSRFLSRMVEGWKGSHGFAVNAEKTRASFASGICGRENVSNMPWCGLLFNMDTMEVTCDYNRYGVPGGRLRHCVTVEHASNCGRVWENRSSVCFKPKLHGLLLDGRINRTRTVALNVYQSAVLCCLKVCAYMLCLDSIQNATFAENVFQTTMDNFTRIVVRTSRKQNHQIELELKMPLSSVQVSYLTRHAFQAALNKKMANRRERRTLQSYISNIDRGLQESERRLSEQGKKFFANMASSFARSQCNDLWSLDL